MTDISLISCYHVCFSGIPFLYSVAFLPVSVLVSHFLDSAANEPYILSLLDLKYPHRFRLSDRKPTRPDLLEQCTRQLSRR